MVATRKESSRTQKHYTEMLTRNRLLWDRFAIDFVKIGRPNWINLKIKTSLRLFYFKTGVSKLCSSSSFQTHRQLLLILSLHSNHCHRGELKSTLFCLYSIEINPCSIPDGCAHNLIKVLPPHQPWTRYPACFYRIYTIAHCLSLRRKQIIWVWEPQNGLISIFLSVLYYPAIKELFWYWDVFSLAGIM